jgi:plastocyanin
VRRRAAIAAGLGGLLLCAAAPADAGSARTTVTIQDNAFVSSHHLRPTLRVRVGTTVTWVWKSQSSHNVTVLHGPERFHTTTHTKGARFRHRMTRAGTYKIVCTLHEPGMRMRIVVMHDGPR